MLELDRKAFTRSVLLPAIKVDARQCNSLRKGISRIILKRPRIKDIVSEESNSNKKLVLLDSSYDSDTWTVEEQQTIANCKGELVQHRLLITYDHYSADQIVGAILPKGIEITTSFETVGHIAHLNLKECHLPFQELIGENSCVFLCI